MAIDPSEANRASGLDKKFLQAALALEISTQELLDDTTGELMKAIEQYAKANEIQDEDGMLLLMLAILGAFFLAYGGLLAAIAFRIAKFKADDAIEQSLPMLRAAGAHDAANAFKRELAGYPEDVRKRFEFRVINGRNVQERIKSVQEGTEKTVRNIVAIGVREGKGAKQIAKDIEQYINPVPGETKIRPWDVYRKRFGRPKNFIPKGVAAGSLQTNALMIARTESAEVYRQATDDFYRDKPWIKGFRWVLSNTHQPEDICDKYSRQEWGKQVKRPFSHPHCLCDWIAVPFDMSELRDMSARGQL